MAARDLPQERGSNGRYVSKEVHVPPRWEDVKAVIVEKCRAAVDSGQKIVYFTTDAGTFEYILKILPDAKDIEYCITPSADRVELNFDGTVVPIMRGVWMKNRPYFEAVYVGDYDMTAEVFKRDNGKQ